MRRSNYKSSKIQGQLLRNTNYEHHEKSESCNSSSSLQEAVVATEDAAEGGRGLHLRSHTYCDYVLGIMCCILMYCMFMLTA